MAHASRLGQYLDDKEDEAHNLVQQRFRNPSSGLHCDVCKFVDKNEQGLKTHTTFQYKLIKEYLSVIFVTLFIFIELIDIL